MCFYLKTLTFIFIQSSFFRRYILSKNGHDHPSPFNQYKYFDITINADRTLASTKGYSCNKLTIKTDINFLELRGLHYIYQLKLL